jgi:RHS repeat-associated protein
VFRPPTTSGGASGAATRLRLATLVLLAILGSCLALGQATSAQEAAPLEGAAPGDPLAEALIAEQRAEERQEAYLESPAAESELERSQTAYEDASGAEASAALEEEFEAELEQLDGDPARALDDERVEETLGEQIVRVDPGAAGGPSELIVSDVPLEVSSGGQVEPVDLRLEQQAGDLVPIAPLVPVSFPGQADAPLRLSELGIGVSLAGAEPAAAREFSEHDVFYPEAARDTDLLAAPLAEGLEVFLQLRSPEAPAEQRLRFSMPAGAELRPTIDGGAEVLASGEVIAHVPRPWALDAQGREVPVEATVSGDELILAVDHAGGEFAYPILVDPPIYDSQLFHGASSRPPEVDEWTSHPAVGSTTSKFSMRYTCLPNFQCFGGGSGWGLYTYADAATYSASSEAHWHYPAPAPLDLPNGIEPKSYIPAAQFRHVYLRMRSDRLAPVLVAAINDKGDGFTAVKTRDQNLSDEFIAVEACSDTQGDDTGNCNPQKSDSAVFGLGGITQSVTLPEKREAYLGGAKITLRDTDNPQITSSQNTRTSGAAYGPGGWVGDATYRADITATDRGLGMRRFELELLQGGQRHLYQDRQSSCLGERGELCRYERSTADMTGGDFTYSTASLPNGAFSGHLRAYDALDKRDVRDFELRVDRENPELTLSGGLTTEGSVAPNTDLHYEASDGSALGSQNQRSGVRKVEIKVNDEPPTVLYNQACDRVEGSCAASGDYTLNLANYRHDDFHIKVTAYDMVGNSTSEEWDVVAGPRDNQPPNIDSGRNALITGSEGPAPGRWTKQASYRVVDVAATDAGYGMKAFETRVPQTGGGVATQRREHDCTGTRASLCPQTWALPSASPPRSEFDAYSTDAMPQGENQVTLRAIDIRGNASSRDFPVRVDREAPTMALAGGLAPEGGATGQNQRLDFTLTDGDPSGPPSAYRSGVRSVELKIDGQRKLFQAPRCLVAKGSCSLSGSYHFELFDFPKNQFDLELLATDEAGNVRTRSWSVELQGGPPRIERILTCAKLAGGCIEGTEDANADNQPDGDPPGWVSSDGLESAIFARDPFDDALAGEERRQRGIEAIRLFMPDGSTPTERVDCPDPDEPCPRYTARAFDHSAAPLDEGRQTIAARARNAAGDASAIKRFTVRVDNRAPQINSTKFEQSELYQAKLLLQPAARYDLTIAASDGTATDPQSGAERIEVFVDGRRVFLDAKPCDGESCGFERTFTFVPAEYGSGERTVEAVVTDGAGNETRRSFKVNNTSPGETSLPAQKFGLESYFHFDSHETGLSGAHVNLGTGNLSWHRVPIMNPGRGLSTVVNTTYNSHDHPLGDLPEPADSRFVTGAYDDAGLGVSIAISGITRVNEPLGGVALSGVEDGGVPPARVTLTDPDGTLHTFSAKLPPEYSSGEALAYEAPPGVNLRLRAYSNVVTDALGLRLLPEQRDKAWAITRPDGVTYFFDGWGFLRSIEDRNLNVMRFEYENRLLDTGVICPVVVPGACEPRLARVIDPAGTDQGASDPDRAARTLRVEYYPTTVLDGAPSLGAAGKIWKLIDHEGRTVELRYDGNGYLREMVEAPNTSDARTFRLEYDTPNTLQDPTAHPQLRTMVDPNGAATLFEYESSTKATLTGRAVKRVTNRAGNQRSYTYSGNEGSGSSTATVTDARVETTTSVLDSRDRPTRITDPIARVSELDWDSDNNVLSHTVAAGTPDEAETQYSYNANGALTSQTDPLGRTTSLEYLDTAGIHRSQYGNGALDDDADDFVSDLVAIRRPAGNEWGYEIERASASNGVSAPNGNVVAQTDPTGVTSEADYFSKTGEGRDFGLVKSENNGVLDASGSPSSVTEYPSYDASGMPSEVIAPRGTNSDASDGSRAEHRWLYAYDDAGNLLQVVDPRGAEGLPPGPLSAPAAETTPFATTLGYDKHYRLAREHLPKDSRAGDFIERGYVYDDNDNLDFRTDGEAKVWDFDYTPMDRLEEELTPEGEKTAYAYDPEEALERITAPRHFDPSDPIQSSRAFVTRFELDDVGRREATVRQGPASSQDLITSYAYDLRDNVVGIALPRNNTVGDQAVDLQAALTNAQGSAGRRFSYEFDKADQLTASLENPAGSCLDSQTPRIRTEYRYDENGNMTRELGSRGFCDLNHAAAQTTIFDYTARDELAAVTDPVGNRTAYSYTADGLIASETTPRGTESEFDGDFTTTYAYDANRDLASWSIPFSLDDDGQGFQYGMSQAEVEARIVSVRRNAVGDPVQVADAVANLAEQRLGAGEFPQHNARIRDQHTFTNTFFDTGDLKQTPRPSWFEYAGPGAPLELRREPANPIRSDRNELPTSQGVGDLGEVGPEEMPGTLPIAGRTTLDYDDEMRLESVEDAADSRLEIAYDAVGRPVQTTRPLDETRSIRETTAYDAHGNPIERVDGELNATTIRYDAFDRIEREIAPGAAGRPGGSVDPRTTIYGYDPNDNLVSRQTPRGPVFTYGYDGADRLVSENDPEGNKTLYAYDAAGNTISETAPKGVASAAPGDFTTETIYDAANRPTTIIEEPSSSSLRRETHLFYDANGNVIREDAPGAPTTIGGGLERRITETSYEGRDLEWKRTVFGDVGSSEAGERTTISEFDPNGNLRRVVNPAGAADYELNPDPGVDFTLREETQAGELIFPDNSQAGEVEGATRNATVYEYTADDLRSSIHLPWDDKPEIDFDEERYRQDLKRNERGWVQFIDSTYEWTAADPESGRTSYDYFKTGWMRSAKDPVKSQPGLPAGEQPEASQAITYDYDRRGLQTLWRSASFDQRDSDPFDPANPARQVTRAYWPSGELKLREGAEDRAAAPDTTRTHRYFYNPNGSLERQLDVFPGEGPSGADGGRTLCYDGAERLTHVDEHNAGPRDTRFVYDRNSNVTHRYTDGEYAAGTLDSCPEAGTSGPTPGGAKEAVFVFDELDRETRMDVTQGSASRKTTTSYYPSGEVRDLTKANDTVERMAYHPDGLVAERWRDLEGGGGTDTEEHSYEYDLNGNRTHDERGDYLFNARDHLVKWTKPSDYEDPGTVTYRVVGSGAIQREVGPQDGQTVTTDYDYVGDRLLTATASAAGQTTTSTFSYDDFGNTTKIVSSGSGQTTTITHDYDEFGRRTRSEGEGADNAGELYTYDGLDRRITRSGADGGATYRYAYVGVSEKLSSERAPAGDPDSAVDARYYDYDSRGNRLGQEARAEVGAASGEFEPYELDPQGTVLGLENEAGVIEAGKAYEYDPYGQLLNEDEISGDETAGANPFRFQGHYYDQGTDVYDMQARSYLPEVGRFMGEDRYEAAGADLALQSDPLTQSRYVFAGGNPVSRVEWDGHKVACSSNMSARQCQRWIREGGDMKERAYQQRMAEQAASAPAIGEASAGVAIPVAGRTQPLRVTAEQAEELQAATEAVLRRDGCTGDPLSTMDHCTPGYERHALEHVALDLSQASGPEEFSELAEQIAVTGYVEAFEPESPSLSELAAMIPPWLPGAGQIANCARFCGKAATFVRGLFSSGDDAGRVAARGSGGALRPYFPPNRGFAGETSTAYLRPGMTIDRYGGRASSRFFSPAGTPKGARSLPPGTAAQPLRSFEVVKPIPVEAGTTAAWFGRVGGGIQYRTPVTLDTLLRRGIIREVGP